MRRLLMPMVLVLLAACATAPRDPFGVAVGDAPVWPPPPEQARLRYAGSFAEHRDLFQESGVGRSLARLFGGPAESHLSRPYAVALHPNGGLIVTDPGMQCVHFYDWKARRYTRFGGDIEGGLPSPVGVAVDQAGNVLVADSRRVAVERFAPDGTHLGRFAGEHVFLRPAGIAVDPASGEVFVADVLAHTVCVFASDGALLRTLGGNGAEAGRFNFPTHVALDGEGNVLVADSMNFRVQRLDRQGGSLTVFGEAGSARGDFAHPKGVAAVAPGVFVAVEGLYDSLVFFDGEGRLLLNVGGPGSGPGEFWLPAGLAFDAERQLLFVADSYNSRVQVFRFLGADSAPGGDGKEGASP
ncbi:MAG: hypothetical protein PWP23_261 [Candidatus Sumerlaeota bacterium]|nr:hypothetical protein [Candidatus Sumerlaeota bacterium]